MSVNDKHRLRDSCFVRADYSALESLDKARMASTPPDHQAAMRWFDDAVLRAQQVGALPAVPDATDLEIKCRYARALNRVRGDRPDRSSI